MQQLYSFEYTQKKEKRYGKKLVSRTQLPNRLKFGIWAIMCPRFRTHILK